MMILARTPGRLFLACARVLRLTGLAALATTATTHESVALRTLTGGTLQRADQPRPAATTSAGPVQLTYLANMGVLLESKEARVLIDGLHHGALSEYAPLLPEVRQALEGARAPFERLSAILATHRHLDHFQAAAVAARMSADTSVAFFAARETVDALLAYAPHLRSTGRVHAMRGGDERQREGLVIRALDLPHNTTPSRRAENLGFVVALGQRRILHVGDADPDPATYRARGVTALRVDAAVVPFWYLTGSAEVLQAIGARRYIGAHIPLADTSRVGRRISSSGSAATPLTTRGMTLTLP